MAQQVKWHNKTFDVSPSLITGITDFQTSFEMEKDTNDDTSGTKKTNTKGRKPEEVSFKVKYLAATGSSPRSAFESWRNLLGVKDYLYISGSRYGANKFELTKVDISDVLMNNSGGILQAVATFAFTEDLPVPVSSSSSKATSSNKSAAKSAKASTTDKSLKSPYTTKTAAIMGGALGAMGARIKYTIN